nr:MAG TPA: Tail fiber protein [Caudoviricetes sp.]
MTKNQTDYIKYWGLFKSNYAKGIRALENILENAQQANELVNNTGAISVILGTPEEREDVNSETLRKILFSKSEYRSVAIENWLKDLFKSENIDDIFSNSENLAKIKEDSVIWRNLLHSDKPLVRYLLFSIGHGSKNITSLSDMVNDTEVWNTVQDNPDALNAILNSPAAIASIVNNTDVLNKVIKSSSVWDKLLASSVATETMANSKNAVEVLMNNTSVFNKVINNTSFWEQIVNSKIAITSIINNQATLNKVLNNSSAWNQVLNSHVAMSIIFDTSTALNKVMNNATAWTATVNSFVAMTALSKNKSAIITVLGNEDKRQTINNAGTWNILLTHKPAIEAIVQDIDTIADFMSNPNFFVAAIHNPVSSTIILNNPEVVAWIANNATILSILQDKPTLFDKVLNNPVAMTAIANNPSAVQVPGVVGRAFSSPIAYDAIINGSPKAIYQIISNSSYADLLKNTIASTSSPFFSAHVWEALLEAPDNWIQIINNLVPIRNNVQGYIQILCTPNAWKAIAHSSKTWDLVIKSAGMRGYICTNVDILRALCSAPSALYRLFADKDMLRMSLKETSVAYALATNQKFCEEIANNPFALDVIMDSPMSWGNWLYYSTLVSAIANNKVAWEKAIDNPIFLRTVLISRSAWKSLLTSSVGLESILTEDSVWNMVGNNEEVITTITNSGNETITLMFNNPLFCSKIVNTPKFWNKILNTSSLYSNMIINNTMMSIIANDETLTRQLLASSLVSSVYTNYTANNILLNNPISASVCVKNETLWTNMLNSAIDIILSNSTVWDVIKDYPAALEQFNRHPNAVTKLCANSLYVRILINSASAQLLLTSDTSGILYKLFNNQTACNEIVNNFSFWNKILDNKPVFEMGLKISTFFNNLLNGSFALTTIAYNMTALDVLLNNLPQWRSIISSATHLKPLMVNESKVWVKVLNNTEAWQAITQNSSAVATILANSLIVEEILKKPECLKQLLDGGQIPQSILDEGGLISKIASNAEFMLVLARSAKGLNSICQSYQASSVVNKSKYNNQKFMDIVKTTLPTKSLYWSGTTNGRQKQRFGITSIDGANSGRGVYVLEGTGDYLTLEPIYMGYNHSGGYTYAEEDAIRSDVHRVHFASSATYVSADATTNNSTYNIYKLS